MTASDPHRATLRLVLLPGLDGTGVFFRPLVAALPPHIEPVVVAYPGDRAESYDELMARVAAALPRTGRFLLLGESFSGPLAVRTAAGRPRGLRGLILSASFVRSPHAFVPQWASALVGETMMRPFPQLSRLKMRLFGFSSPELRALSVEALSRVTPAVLAARLREVIAVDVRRELAACPVPLLYLRGSRDAVVPARNCREVLSIVPSAREVVVDAPHLVLQTRAVECAGAIAAFAAGLT